MNITELREISAWATDHLAHIGYDAVQANRPVGRVRSELGGSHTVVTYPPLDALAPTDATSVMDAVEPVAALNLYAHVAFCEFLCPFCHYDTTLARAKTGESERMRDYFDALHREFAIWKERLTGSTLASFYIGGGTPTSASTGRLLKLLEETASFAKRPDFLVCVETSPMTATAADGPAKLEALVSAGVRRFSVGVQTFSSDLLHRTRGHRQNVVLDALDLLLGLVDNVNVDLIQDLPDQTEEDLLSDLVYIGRFLPAQVTWYLLRLRPEAAFYDRYRRGQLNLAGARESARRRLIILEAMRRLGYESSAGGRFVRSQTAHDRFKDIRAGLTSALLGIGVSAYSHGWGKIFRNVYSQGRRVDGIQQYTQRVLQGNPAIHEALSIDKVEAAASQIVVGIRTGIHLPEGDPETAEYVCSARATIESLERAGLVEDDPVVGYRLSLLGKLFEEEICSLFYSSRVKEALRAKSAFWQSGAELRTRQSRISLAGGGVSLPIRSAP
jgi:oxygen-independent coproporphyrinogen III oxidase